ncbi:hypothetical protein BDV25DRAFT_146351 [Aspergillus avenaceus]|uniref:Uncharacterized protein n=1 Tax=Aspergillus avenaceus TaxID=36643 RepID=A0A5N6U9C9_ASPAV|nr:hypothetical protein BDV25DRAFT_146351 [Aspergillus avenaceus]
MPALPPSSPKGRPPTDYERWLQERDPDTTLCNEPQYGPDHDGNCSHLATSSSLRTRSAAVTLYLSLLKLTFEAPRNRNARTCFLCS